MTAAQNQALNQITEIMREHFEAGVVLAIGDVDPETPDLPPGFDVTKASDHAFTYHGGKAACIGLMEMGRIKVWQDHFDQRP